MKNFYLLFVALIMSFGLYAQTTAVEPTQGDGSQENPYQIENLAHLRWLSETNSVWSQHFIQTADIDATETATWNEGDGFSPIGDSPYFTGSYNGDYKKISNLTINRPNTNYIGLFGITYGATIEKLQLENVNIEGLNNVGGVVGYNDNNSIISQVSAKGSINGYNSVGGISGLNSNSTIKESFSDADVYTTYENNGGITGYNGSGTIENCYSLSVIYTSNRSSSGGITGESSSGTLVNNYFAGTIIGESGHKGGIISYGGNPETDSGNFWDGEKSGITHNIGNGIAKTTAEMKDILTFTAADWEFAGLGLPNEIWDIDENLNNGYPYLVWAQQYIEDTSTNIKQKAKTGEVVAIYPNPFNDIVNITGNGINSVQVYTMSGVQMIDVKYNSESEVTIQTSDFDKGIYLFVVDNGGNVETYKLVKR